MLKLKNKILLIIISIFFIGSFLLATDYEKVFNPFTKKLDYIRNGSSTTVLWGNILGTLANQTDLQTVLNSKISTDGSIPLIANWNAGQYTITSKSLVMNDTTNSAFITLSSPASNVAEIKADGNDNLLISASLNSKFALLPGGGGRVFVTTPKFGIGIDPISSPELFQVAGDGFLDNLRLQTGGALKTSKLDTNTLFLQAYDVDGASYKTFLSMIAGNTPTCVLSGDITTITQSQADNSTKIATTEYVDIGLNVALSSITVNQNDINDLEDDMSVVFSSITVLQDEKADKVSGAVTSNFAGLDGTGNLTDSGSKASDFEIADATILKQSNVINNLTSTSTIYPLSANQGKVLQDNKEATFSKNTAFNKNFGSINGSVCEGDDSRLSDSRVPLAHALGGSLHNADTLANINSKISDATLIDTGDSRLSNSRVCNNTFDNVNTTLGNLGLSTTDSPNFSNLYLNEHLYHQADSNTFLRFQPDQFTIGVGGETLIDAIETTNVYRNNNTAEIDFFNLGYKKELLYTSSSSFLFNKGMTFTVDSTNTNKHLNFDVFIENASGVTIDQCNIDVIAPEGTYATVTDHPIVKYTNKGFGTQKIDAIRFTRISANNWTLYISANIVLNDKIYVKDNIGFDRTVGAGSSGQSGSLSNEVLTIPIKRQVAYSGNIEIEKYTQVGANSPAIQCRTYSGTLPAANTSTQYTAANLGLTSALQILSLRVWALDDSGHWVLDGSALSTKVFNVRILSGGNVQINLPAESVAIDNNNFKMVYFYQETNFLS